MAAADRRLLADGLLSRGLVERAAAEYGALLRDFPDIAERDVVLFRWGDSLRQSHRMEEADGAFARLLAEFPQSGYTARATFGRGAIALASGRYAESAALLRKTMELDASLREDSLYYLGEALSHDGQDTEAIARLEEFLSSYPDSGYAWFAKISLASALERRAGEAGGPDADRARALLREAASAPNPDIAADALYLLGQCDFIRGDYEASSTAFAELRKRFPESRYTAESALTAAWAADRTGRPAETLALADAALRDETVPKRDEWLYLRGRALFQLDRDAEATSAMENLVNTVAESRYLIPAAFACAAGHARLGNHAKAVAIFALIPKDDPLRPRVLQLCASSHEAMGQADKAIECCRELDASFPDDENAETTLFRLARLLQAAERWDESAPVWERFAKRFPKSDRHAQALYSAGVCHKAAGRVDEAIAAWDALAAAHSGDPLASDARYLAGIELFRLKRADEALARFDDFLAHAGQSAGHLADARFYRGCLLVEKDRLDDALASFRAARDASPGAALDAEARYQIWFVLQKLNRLDEAADEFDALLGIPSVASRLQPEQIAWTVEHQYHRGRLDQAGRAARFLADNVAQDDWRQTAWAWLGRVEAARGNAAAAETAFRNTIRVPAETRYAAEAFLRLGEYRLAIAGKDIDAAERYFTQAVERSQAADMVDIRIRATIGLAHVSLAKGLREEAANQLFGVCMISRDDALIPPLIAEAVPLLRELGQTREADALLEDLRTFYPQSEAARALLPPEEPAP